MLGAPSVNEIRCPLIGSVPTAQYFLVEWRRHMTPVPLQPSPCRAQSLRRRTGRKSPCQLYRMMKPTVGIQHGRFLCSSCILNAVPMANFQVIAWL